MREGKNCHTCAKRSHDHPDYCDLGYCTGHELAVFRARALKKVLNEQLPGSTRHLELRDSKDIPIGNIERQEDVEDPMGVIREMAGVSPPDLIVAYDESIMEPTPHFHALVIRRGENEGDERHIVGRFRNIRLARAWCVQQFAYEGFEIQYSLDLTEEENEEIATVDDEELAEVESSPWNDVDLSPIAEAIREDVDNRLIEEITEQNEDLTNEEIHDDFIHREQIHQEPSPNRLSGSTLGHTNRLVGAIRTGITRAQLEAVQLPNIPEVEQVTLRVHPEDCDSDVTIFMGDIENQEWPITRDVTVPLSRGNLDSIWIRSSREGIYGRSFRVFYMAQVMIEG